MTQEKLLDKLGKLKRHAESAKQIGNEAEAQAFAEMFQKLVWANKLDVSELDFTEQEQQEPVDRHFIDYAKYGMKLKHRRSEWIQSLGHVVAEAHFCRILVHAGSSRITLVGRKSDCEVAEYVLVTLQRAAEKMSKKAYYKYWFDLADICIYCGEPERKHPIAGHKFTYSTAKAAGFQGSWLTGFVDRLGQRYRELRQGRTGESMALIRVNKAEAAVIQWIKDNIKGTSSALSRSHRWNHDGLAQGRDAANKLDLGSPKAVKAGTQGKLRG